MAHRAPKTVEFPNHQRVAAAHIARGIGLDDIERLAGFLERGALVVQPGAALATSGEDVAGGTRIAPDGPIQRPPLRCGVGWRHAHSQSLEHATPGLPCSPPPLLQPRNESPPHYRRLTPHD